jgi:hypothetical protein
VKLDAFNFTLKKDFWANPIKLLTLQEKKFKAPFYGCYLFKLATLGIAAILNIAEWLVVPTKS